MRGKRRICFEEVTGEGVGRIQDGNEMNTWREDSETDDIAITGRCCFPFQQLERGSSAPVSHLYTQNVDGNREVLTQDTVSKSSARTDELVYEYP